MKDKTIHIGVAGLGFGAQVHVPVFQSLPNVSVAALLGTDAKRVKNFARERDIPKACTNFKEFFEQEMDAVSLALPPQWNAKVAFLALKQGLPVLVEKPIAGSWQQAKKLLEASRGKLVMVDFQFPELPVFQQLKKIIEEKKYGNVRHASLLWELESYAHHAKKWSWKTSQRAGGGVLTLLGSHFLYLAEWLFGRVKRLTAHLDSRATKKISPKGTLPAPDSLTALLEFSNGSFLNALISNASPGGGGHRWEIAFEKATAILYNPPGDYMSGFSLMLRTREGEFTLSQDRRQAGKDGRLRPFQKLAERFIEAVRTGRKKISPSLADGVRVQYLMESVVTSSQKSKWIFL